MLEGKYDFFNLIKLVNFFRYQNSVLALRLTNLISTSTENDEIPNLPINLHALVVFVLLHALKLQQYKFGIRQHYIIKQTN